MTDPTTPDPPPAPTPGPAFRSGHWWFLCAVFLVSGAVSLVYQVLWMRRLGLLFGNTAQAAATTLTAFFLGLALGGWAAGQIAPRLRNPLRAYGWVEIGIAAGALFYFGLMDLYGTLYAPLFRALGHRVALFLLLKLTLGVLVLLPAASLIGATLPLVGQHLLRRPGMLGRGGTFLYAVNTAGAAIGAYLAGFVLPLALGFRGAYLLAMVSNVLLGAAILVAARRTTRGQVEQAEAPDALPAPAFPTWPRIRALAFLSGLVTLALEVLWTHMFAQVLHNSVYTFAIILIVFLAALAAGSLLAHRFVQSQRPVVPTLVRLLGAGALLVVVSPWLFYALTGGLRYVADNQGWAGYQAVVAALAIAVIGLPTLLLGTVFPYLLKLSEPHSRSAGRTLGRLVAINTTAGIVGSLLAGFVLLGWIGLWPSIRLVGWLSLAGIPIVAARAIRPAAAAGWGLAAGALLVVTIGGFGGPPLLKLDPETDEQLVQLWEGSSGVVAVVRNAGGLIIKVNNHYTLGGSGSVEDERRQGLLPLLLHPDPEEVFYLGMGTGITASAAMTPHVRRATVCELVPDVITAARTHFGPFTAGLFTDPRTRIVAEDGRTFLGATDERYDVIISDLFVPWEARAGSLYSLEHFEAARDHLKPGGIFAQWIPLYQMSRREFAIVARTMLEVFPQVTVWRGDWKITTPTLALIGQMQVAPLDPGQVARRIAETPDPALLSRTGSGAGPLLWGYCGNLVQARSLVEGAPLNTDDHPLIEYLAPVTHRRAGSHHARFLTLDEMIRLLADLQKASPPERDPYLARVPPATRLYARVGFLSAASAVLQETGTEAESDSVDTEMSDLLVRIIQQESGPGR